MSEPTRQRWLFGPLPDLVLGTGGAYLVVFLFLVGTPDGVQRVMPLALMPLLVLVTSIPHYGATLLRVYGQGADRRRYRFFGLWLTLLVYAWFVVGVYDPAIGSALVTLYLTWSPWHYSGQNYGIAVMFLGRRGVKLAPAAKRWLYASFLCSFALAFLGIHTAGSVDSYAPGSLAPEAYSLVRLGIPAGVAAWALLGVTLAYGVCLAASGAALLRAGRPRDVAPAAALVALQGLWFAAPVLARATGVGAGLAPFGGDGAFREYAFLWIAVGHAVQYLWVTTYFAARSEGGLRRLGYLVKALAAGGVAFGAPLLLFGPDTLGVRSYDAGLALLIAAAVNVHHFLLDGAIWKLRDGRIARVLLRGAGAEEIVAGATRWGRTLATVLLGAGLFYGASFAYAALEFALGVKPAQERGDLDRLRSAAKRLRWIGRDDASLHHNLAVGSLRAGDPAVAEQAIRRSLELEPSAAGWVVLGLARERSGNWRGARDAYQRASERDPRHVPAWVRLAGARSQLGDRAGAAAALRRGLELAPGRDDLRARLATLEAAR